MKISLLTIWHIGNYGAELQTYCTVKVLNELGHDVQVVRYDLKDDDNNKTSELKQCIFNFITGLMPANLKSQWFWLRHIPSTKKYKSLKDVYDNPPLADAYIVGSDQVWNPEITKQSAPLFFLDFINKDIRKLSYASSFGVSEWNGDTDITAIALENFKHFSGISCREKSGVKILNSIFKVQAQCVLDPTLLVENYKSLTKGIVERQTLAYYPLSPNPTVETFCKMLSKELGLEYKQVNKRTILRRYMLWNKPSVPQWLKNIGEARFVITPSFHGLTTSIMQHRNFAILITEPLILKRSARIRDLLEELGLEDRFFTSVESFYKSRIWEKTIDYIDVDSKLSVLRKKSYKYLKDNLS